MNIIKITLTAFLLLTFSCLSAQSITGKWKTVDDKTGKVESVIEIYKKDGKYYGKVVRLFIDPNDKDQNPVCFNCTDYRKNQKILGMEIITAMEYDSKNKEYKNGKILDPESGDIYTCKLWIDNSGNLKVRGYLYFFYRTQTWLPFKE